MGFCGMTLNWVQSNLSSHTQMADINGTQSQIMGCGVPQGSILGPLLFLLYINVLKAAASCNPFYVLTILFRKIKQQELQNVSRWLADNRLSLH